MYIRSIDSLEVRPLPGSEGIIVRSPPPFWSYDSRFVVYGALGKLKKSEITGTPAQTIAETGLPFVQGGTWNGDGVILYAKTTSNMEQVASSGGTPVAATMLAPAERAHRWPQFLPDGRRFLYQRVSNVPEKTGVYVGSLDVKPEDQSLQPLLLTDKQAWWVTSEGSGKTYLLMQREEALLAQSFDIDSATLSGVPIAVATGVGSFPMATAGLWSVARNGALVYRSGGTGLPQMTWVDLTGRTVGTVAEGGLYAGLAVSPEGTRIAYGLTDVQGNTDIWVRDLVSGSTTKLTFDPHPDNRPVWSHDGTKVMFAANRSGRFDLYEKNADGSGEERLLVSSDQNKYPTSASRDGRFLLFASNGPNAQDDLWVLPLDGERKPFVFLNTDAHETQGQFSPDQRWIAYHSDDRRDPTGVRASVLTSRPFGGWRNRFPMDHLGGRRFVSAMERERQAAFLRRDEQRFDGRRCADRNQFWTRCLTTSLRHRTSRAVEPKSAWRSVPLTPDGVQRRSAATDHDGAELDDEARAVRVTTMCPRETDMLSYEAAKRRCEPFSERRRSV